MQADFFTAKSPEAKRARHDAPEATRARQDASILTYDIAIYLVRMDMKHSKCKRCNKSIPWARDRVASHKLASCRVEGGARIDEEEADFFRRFQVAYAENKASKTFASESKDTKLSQPFWDALSSLTTILEFPSNIIGKFEKDSSDLFVVYDYFRRLKAHWTLGANEFAKECRCLTANGLSKLVKSVPKDVPVQATPTGRVSGRAAVSKPALTPEGLAQLTDTRWIFLHTASMGFAYLLTPQGLELPWDRSDKVDTKHELMQFIDKFPMDEDRHVSQAMRRECKTELVWYMKMRGDISQKQWNEFSKMKGKEYWETYGRDTYPKLFKIAARVFNVPTSSASIERAWSAFAFIWSKRRNRLAVEKVDKLAFLYINSALLDDKDTCSYIEEYLDSEDEADMTLQTAED